LVGVSFVYEIIFIREAMWKDGFIPIGECNLPELDSWKGKADGWNPYWRI
jgi:hypothetical protein